MCTNFSIRLTVNQLLQMEYSLDMEFKSIQLVMTDKYTTGSTIPFWKQKMKMMKTNDDMDSEIICHTTVKAMLKSYDMLQLFYHKILILLVMTMVAVILLIGQWKQTAIVTRVRLVMLIILLH
eukprot:420299_1